MNHVFLCFLRTMKTVSAYRNTFLSPAYLIKRREFIFQKALGNLEHFVVALSLSHCLPFSAFLICFLNSTSRISFKVCYSRGTITAIMYKIIPAQLDYTFLSMDRERRFEVFLGSCNPLQTCLYGTRLGRPDR